MKSRLTDKIQGILGAELRTQPTNDRNEQSRRSAVNECFRRVVVPFLEHGIMLDVLEHVLKEANPLVQELYLGTVENLQAEEAAEVNQLLIQTLEVQPAGR
jgi:formate dehydrogenase maturation protein FdhE